MPSLSKLKGLLTVFLLVHEMKKRCWCEQELDKSWPFLSSTLLKKNQRLSRPSNLVKSKRNDSYPPPLNFLKTSHDYLSILTLPDLEKYNQARFLKDMREVGHNIHSNTYPICLDTNRSVKKKTVFCLDYEMSKGL